MIPTIGVLIASYIFLRCLEILATASRIESKGNRRVIMFVAVCVVLLSVYSAMELIWSSASVMRQFQGLPDLR